MSGPCPRGRGARGEKREAGTGLWAAGRGRAEVPGRQAGAGSADAWIGHMDSRRSLPAIMISQPRPFGPRRPGALAVQRVRAGAAPRPGAVPMPESGTTLRCLNGRSAPGQGKYPY